MESEIEDEWENVERFDSVDDLKASLKEGDSVDTEDEWANAPVENTKPEYIDKINTEVKSQIDTMYDANSIAIDKAIEANPELKYVAESRKAKNELGRIEAYNKAYKEQRGIEKDKLQDEKIEEAKTTGEADKVDIGSRVKATADDMIFGIWENLYAPMLDKLGESGASTELRVKAEEAKRTLSEVNAKYKEIYGEDAMNIAGGVTELVPNLVGGMAAGGKTITEAVVETGIEYAKTGDVKTALSTGLLDLAGGKIADTVFSQQASKWFSKDVEALPLDEKNRVKDGLTAAMDAGVDRLDAEGRKRILGDIDLTKPKGEMSKEIRSRLSMLKEEKGLEVEDAYNLAHEIAKQSTPVEVSISDIRTMMDDQDLLGGKNVNKAIVEIKKNISSMRTKVGRQELNAREMETIISNLKAEQRVAKGSGIRAYGTAIEYFTKKQEDLVGDIYGKPRELSKEFNTRFKGTISNKGADTGAVISKSLDKEQTYGQAKALVGEDFDANKVDDLLDYKIPQEVRTDMVKDVLTDGLDIEDLENEKAISKILGRWNNANEEGLKNMLGGKSEFDKMGKKMYALELIQNTMSATTEDKKLLKSIADFSLNASMLKISPLFAYKGMAHEGKNIASAIAFKKRATELKSSMKHLKDKKTANSIMRAFNIIIATSASEWVLLKDDTVNQYEGKKIRMQED